MRSKAPGSSNPRPPRRHRGKEKDVSTIHRNNNLYNRGKRSERRLEETGEGSDAEQTSCGILGDSKSHQVVTQTDADGEEMGKSNDPCGKRSPEIASFQIHVQRIKRKTNS